MKLLAALIFFTRLPFWRIADVPSAYFKRVVDYWPFVGWLTGGNYGRNFMDNCPVSACAGGGTSCIGGSIVSDRRFARRWLGRFLRWLWRRDFTGKDFIHYERFPYRYLWSYRVDLLLWVDVKLADYAVCAFGLSGYSEWGCLE